jgi:hypothetical protein
MYWTTPARALFDASAAHTNLGLYLLRSTAGGARSQLARSVAESALLSGRLAFFDLAELSAAQSFLNAAQALAQEAEDHALAAAILGHIAFGPGFAGDGPSATAALDAAWDHAARAQGPRLQSWLHCVGAEISARTGDSRTALLQARQAEDALTEPGIDPTWLDFYDSSRLAGFTGYVQLLAGDNRAAATTFEGALTALPASAGRPAMGSILLLDLATAYADSEREHALQVAGQAVETLRRDWYATARDRVPALRAALGRTPYLGQLEERLRSLSGLAS